MDLDTVLIGLAVILMILIAVGFLKLTRENPKLLGGVGGFGWDKFVQVFQPKRNYSILEDPEEEELD